MWCRWSCGGGGGFVVGECGVGDCGSGCDIGGVGGGECEERRYIKFGKYNFESNPKLCDTNAVPFYIFLPKHIKQKLKLFLKCSYEFW